MFTEPGWLRFIYHILNIGEWVDQGCRHQLIFILGLKTYPKNHSRGLGSPKNQWFEIRTILGFEINHYPPRLFQSASRLFQSFWFIPPISTHCQWVGTLPIIFDVFKGFWAIWKCEQLNMGEFVFPKQNQGDTTTMKPHHSLFYR